MLVSMMLFNFLDVVLQGHCSFWAIPHTNIIPFVARHLIAMRRLHGLGSLLRRQIVVGGSDHASVRSCMCRVSSMGTSICTPVLSVARAIWGDSLYFWLLGVM